MNGNEKIYNGLEKTHCFVYKGIEYPFNFDVFIANSKFMQREKKIYKHKNKINLIDIDEDKKIELSEESINIFVKYCQMTDLTHLLNDKNVGSVIFLAEKYEVDGLYKEALNYMGSNTKNFVLDICSFKQNNSRSLNPIHEDIISSNLTEYINDDRLLNYDLVIIDRILKKYIQRYRKDDDGIDEKIIDVKFSYLKKYGKEASVLFSDVDLSTNSKYMNRLLVEFADNFDFHFINESLSRNIYQMENNHLKIIYENIVKLKESIKQFKKKAKNQFDHIIADVTQKSKEYTQIMNDFLPNIKEFNQIKIEYANIKSKFEKNNNENLMLKQQFSNIQKENEQISKNSNLIKEEIDQVTKQNTQLTNEITQLRNELDNLKNEIAQMKTKSPLLTTQNSQTELDQIKKINELLQKDNSNIKAECSQTKAESFQAKQECSQIKKELDQIQKNYANIKSDLSLQIEKLQKEITSYNQQIKANNQQQNNKLNEVRNECNSDAKKLIDQMEKKMKNNINIEINVEHYKVIKLFNSRLQKYLDIDAMNKTISNSITSFYIPDYITTLSNKMFYECGRLTDVRLPSSLTEIGDMAFFKCSSLRSISIPYTVLEIGKNAFLGCSSLTYLSIPKSVAKIHEACFKGCTNLYSISFNASITEIERFVFSSCTSLKQFSIPFSVSKIEDYAFYGCSALETVTVPSSIISIGDGAFNECPKLAKISIPVNASIYQTTFYRTSITRF